MLDHVFMLDYVREGGVGRRGKFMVREYLPLGRRTLWISVKFHFAIISK